MQLNKKSEHKENSKAWWDERFAESGSGSFLYSKEPSGFLMSYLDLLPKSAKILEIACGEGRNAVALAAKGYDVTALDFSNVALERAKALASGSGVEVHFRALDLDFYLPELLTFDAIVTINFRPSAGLIKNIGRGLKEKGHLIMEAPLMESAKVHEKIEAFECFKPNELLQLFTTQPTFQVLYYSELGDAKWGENVFLIAKKSQLL
jgi:SAM-dependent methyltransferase